jgi:hypothetical protein
MDKYLSYVPSKKEILENIDNWSRKTCIKSGEGSVLFDEDKGDNKRFGKCPIFLPSTVIKKRVLYQYILYIEKDGNVDVKYIPTTDREIGTKHNCLIRYLKDGDKIVASGEFLVKSGKFNYSCMSSFFLDVFKLISKKTDTSREKWESTVVKLFFEEWMNDYKVFYEKDIKHEKGIFDPDKLCSIPMEQRPECLRYLKDEDCNMIADRPEGGETDCDAGVDFCSYQDGDEIPKYIVKDADYIVEMKPDLHKMKEYLEEKGIEVKGRWRKPVGKVDYFMKMTMNTRDMTEDERKEKFYSPEIIWPPEEKRLEEIVKNLIDS